MVGDDIRSRLPHDADNYYVWCERCGRIHLHFTMTVEQFDGIIAEGARKLAAAIDEQAVAYAYGQLEAGR